MLEILDKSLPLSYKFVPADTMNISNFLPPAPLVVGRNRSTETIIDWGKHSGSRVLNHLYMHKAKWPRPVTIWGSPSPDLLQPSPSLTLTRQFVGPCCELDC